MAPRTRYAKCGELNIAYQVTGEGPLDIVLVPSFVSNVEFWWAHPVVKAWLDRLASFSRLILFDKAGTGLSDPVPGPRTLEQRIGEVEAVMDAVDSRRAALFGLSEGAPMSILFSATGPDRVQALVLFGALIVAAAPDASPEEMRADLAGKGLPERYWPTDAQLERFAALQKTRDSWGKGEVLAELVPSLGDAQQLGMLERLCASPGMARATLQSAVLINVIDVLPTITVPTLVVHADEDLVPVQFGRFAADQIPGARMLEVKGRDHAPWFVDHADLVAEEVEEFLTGARHAGNTERVLSTVLFTDIVGSTERATELGDARWRAVLERHGEVTRAELGRYGGKAVKATGDGFLATFDGPARAIHGTEAIRDAVGGLGIAIRAGIHTGECEIIGEDVGGIAVHIAARVSAMAGAGEILVSRTVRDLVVGSGIAFEERGIHSLKGVPGEWSLLAVVPAEAVQGSAEVQLAKMETPGPRESMRIGDRVAAAVARRAPGVLRAANRLQTRRRASRAAT
jgi:pimeloyl-ACP methyl ester carboxylesterase